MNKQCERFTPTGRKCKRAFYDYGYAWSNFHESEVIYPMCKKHLKEQNNENK